MIQPASVNARNNESPSASPPFFYSRNNLELALKVKYLQTEAEFLALHDAWNQLAEKTAPTCIFLRHEWFTAAWQWVKSEATLYLLCVYRQDELIGLCPLVRRHNHRWGFGFWHMEFLAVPDTQRCDILGSPADASEIIEAIAGALKQVYTAWDICILSNLASDALTLKLPAVLQRQHIKTNVLDSPGNPFVTLNGSWQDFYACRSRRLKKNNNLIANRLKGAGEPEVLWFNKILDRLELEAWLETIIGISSKSWKEKTGLSLDYAGPQRFIRALSEVANQQNWLSLWLLKLNGKAIAMEYQLCYAGQVHALRADFDEDFVQYSPGAYLNWQLLKDIFSSGAECYYMGPGNNAYKLRWTDHQSLLQRLDVYSKSWRGRLLYAIDMYGRPLRRGILKILSFKMRPNP